MAGLIQVQQTTGAEGIAATVALTGNIRSPKTFSEILATGAVDPIPLVNNVEARIATHRAIAERFGVNHVVMFDDTAFAVPEDQQQHLAALPGYERALLPAMMFALSGVNTSLIVTAPPLPIELAYALGIYQENGGNVNLMQLLYANPITGENVNLLNLNQDEYLELMSEYYAFIQTPQGEVTKKDTFRHAHAVNKLLEDGLISGDNPTLVMPFQTTEAHYSYAQEHDWMNNGVKLLDNASNVRDKIVLYQALKDQGIVPDFRAVLATADSKGQQYLHLNDLPESEKDEAITDYATRVIQATMELEAVHGGAFIKLDSIGVSGIANVSTKAYPDVYNQDLGLVERVTALKAAIVEKKIHVLTDAVIEQFVEIEQDPVYGELEFTISGFALDGTYMPWAVDKFQTEDGTYVSNYQANTAEQLGISAEDAKALYTIVNQAVTALKQAGLYSDGYIAFDVFRNKSTGKWMIHDPNLRRGGRSVLEAQVVMDRENKTRPIFNKEYMMQVSGAFLTEAEAHANMPTNPMQTISDRITNMKTELGDPQIGLYGTGFTYFPKLMQLQNGTWCWAVKSKLLMGLDPLKRTSEQSQQSEERLSIIGAADKLAAQYGAVL